MHWNEDSLEESRLGFLRNNQLAERWQSPQNKRFVLGETGFGAGLNFLAAWALWLEIAPPDARLDYICVETNPLEQDEIKRALALWPQLSPLSEQLLQCYPCLPCKGFHRLNFDEARVNLTLIIDDTRSGFDKLLQSQHPLFSQPITSVDAWFFDAGALAHYTETGPTALISTLAKLSSPGTTIAAHSTEEQVLASLGKAGFKVNTTKGFKDSEMLSGYFDKNPEKIDPGNFVEGAYNSPYPLPWNCTRSKPFTNRADNTLQALVIGGGIAGCHTARALANRGYQVTLLEQHTRLATQGSGNPQGVLYGKLSPREETLAEFNISALEFGQRAYQEIWDSRPELGQQCGVLQLAHPPKEEKLHRSLLERYGNANRLVKFVSAEQASSIAGVEIPHSGLFFPKAGWINPALLCKYLVDHPNIKVQTQAPVDSLSYDEYWRILDAQGNTIASAANVVIATANSARHFNQVKHLPIKPVRGQVSYLPATEASRALKTAICSEGYITPADPLSNSHCTGASFDVRAPFNAQEASAATKTSDHLGNLDKLERPTPALARALGVAQHRENAAALEGRAAYRCTSPDYLPLAGPAPRYEAFLQDYALLRKNAKSAIPKAGDYWPGLYLNVGHGSRGLTYAALTAELVASQIDLNPLPLPRHLVQALNPARFIIRDLIRKKI